MYVLQTGDTKFAKELYDHMATFRNDNVFSRYYGGYVTGENNNTHIFDNVLPLLAEIELKVNNKRCHHMRVAPFICSYNLRPNIREVVNHEFTELPSCF